jgi:cytochrome c556
MSAAKYVMLVAGLLLAGNTISYGAEAEDQIKYRKTVMRIIGSHMSGISAILRGKVDNDDLKVHAAGLHAASLLVANLFPVDSDFGDTRTLDEVWGDPEGFDMAVKQLETSAGAFAAAVNGDTDIGTAMRDLGASCKGCHDDYRAEQN